MGLFSRKFLSKPTITHKQVGDKYETVAKNYLVRHGLSLIEQNFIAKCGEIDLIMRHNNTVVFAEVKYRKQTGYGHAAEMVTAKKSQKLLKTANVWLMQQGLSVHSTDFRFDIVAIEGPNDDIDWIKNAITQG
ncbi:YraN family protein [Vibrio lentus]|uniref:YraN family protein n=1 Tax=Vibrio lentus TaxID=136468 RepID=UPI000C8445AC|nr:YraN family protein [Vibrio lentus]PMI42702.1 YraN family protein [Vibrio lentus]PMI63588.1 YraN family protein [Vibrio lentus]PMJ51766.1 YraN family protein [Vibrio lentus]PMN02809.1 YraN family protein [Vibrio lentus]